MTERIAPNEHLRLVGAALALALAFTTALVNYYRSFHAGVGPAFAATVIGLPVALLLALATGYGARAMMRRRAGSSPVSLRWVILAMLGSLIVLFTAEWLRTSRDRQKDKLATTTQLPNVSLELSSRYG